MTQTDTNANSRTRRNLLIFGAIAVVLLVIGGLAFFFGGEEPEEATLEDAVSVVEDSQASTTTTVAEAEETPAESQPPADSQAPAEEGPEVPADAGADGTWMVDTSIGEFSYEDATSTFVGFRVDEELSSIGSTTAVGRTPEVSGMVEIEGSTLTAASITANLDEITTDRSRRDNAVKRSLDTASFPEATFVLAEPVDFGAVPADGESVAVTAPGELTIKGVSQTVDFPLEAQVVGDVVVVVGSIEITFADYGVSVPSAPVVLSADDFGIIEVQLFLTR